MTDQQFGEPQQAQDAAVVPVENPAPPAVPQPTYLPQQPVDQRPVVADGLQMKHRNPVAAWIGLPIITLGIYFFVWYYKIHKEMAQFDRRRVVPVAGPMLVMLFLGWTIIAPLISFYNTGKRIATAQRAAGMPASCSPGLGLLLWFVFGLGILYYQSELNKVIDLHPNVPEGSRVPLYV
jgi:Domain of unknown function (DUF4234)